jgi:arylsulfatase A-like enzyme
VTQFIGGHAVGRLCDVPYFHRLPQSEYSLASALREGGYQTWHVGKWHLGGRGTLPEDHGFDRNIGGFEAGMPAQGYFSPYGFPNLEDGPEGEYLTDRLTEEAIALMDKRDPEKPFFLNFWHYTVHTPIQAREDDIERYRKKAAELGLDKLETFAEGEPHPCAHKHHLPVKRRLLQSDPVYAAMIHNLDQNVGRLMEALERTGQADNTVIVFTSDNGGLATSEGSPTCNAPASEGKGWTYEGGNRVPLFITAPGRIQAGSTCPVPVTSTDFYPTLLDLAGLEPIPDQHRDGETLVPLLDGGGALKREAIFWHYPHYSNQGGAPACAIRAGDDKLIEHFEDGRLELFDLREDIGEHHDLARTHPDRAKALHRRLLAWRESVEALIPKANPRWHG